MPLEVDQKQLKRAYQLISLYHIIYVLTPVIILLYLIDFALWREAIDLLYIGVMSLSFILFAKRIFVNHERITYLFEGKYYGADKEKLKKFWGLPPIGNKLYGWLPLPLIEPPRKKWRS